MSAREKHLPNLNQFEQTAVENVRVGGNFTIETITQNISQIVIKETGDRPPKVIEIDWREVCSQVLTHQQENQRLRRKATELGFELNVYVPLGLVERKQQQRRSASDDVEREDVYQLSEEVITKEYKHDAFLNEVIGVNSTDNKHVAIVGEPGAGKTTLLTKIADWIDKNEKGLPICISLANLQKKSLEKYLLEDWLKEVLALDCIDSEARHYKEAVKESLKERFCAGGVWLLLDGLDEMAVSSSSSALAEIQRELSGWVARARVALTSRLNVWDFSLNNPLANFETYRTLEFSQEDVEKFIKDWFAAAKNQLLGTQLQAELEASQYQRVRELVKNPLRLALLCQTWYHNQGDLPETRAGLYQRFVFYFPQWRVPECLHSLRDDEKDDLIDELNIALGKLAKEAIDSPNRFRLPKNFCRQRMKLSSKEIANKKDISLFQLARDFGWLNLVDRDRETEEEVYAFFHPSFQEYFATTAIDDWHFFLNHIPQNPLQGTYRIFEPQWKEVILLWLGRPDEEIAKNKKEAFIDALVEFDDGCGEDLSQYQLFNKGFYEDRAYFLAAAGIAEFGDYSRANEIVEQIVLWGFGYLDEEEKNKKLRESAREALLGTERTKAIAALVQLLESTEDDSIRYHVTETLGKIGTGNQIAITALVKLLESTEDGVYPGSLFEALGKIGTGNQIAITALVKLLESPPIESHPYVYPPWLRNQYTPWQAAETLGKIDPGNEIAIASLAKLLESTEDGRTLESVVETLGKIGTGNQIAITALVKLLESTEDERTRIQAAEALGKIDPGNRNAIAALVNLLVYSPKQYIGFRVVDQHQENFDLVTEALGIIDPGYHIAVPEVVNILQSIQDESILEQAVESLGEIGTGNEKAITTLVNLLESTQDESTRERVAVTLGTINPGNTNAITALVNLLESTQDESIRERLVESLGEIGTDNERVIAALEKLRESTENKENCIRVATSLGKINPGNETATEVLINLIKNSKDQYTREWATVALGDVGKGNKTAIAELVSILESTKKKQKKRIRSRAVASLGEIGRGNETAIAALANLLQSTQDEDTLIQAAESLWTIESGNETAIVALANLLHSTQDEPTRIGVTHTLRKIGKGNTTAISALVNWLIAAKCGFPYWQAGESYWNVASTLEEICSCNNCGKVVATLRSFLNNNPHQCDNAYYKDKYACYRVIQHCAQIMTYPAFYQAWNKDNLDTSATQSLDLADLPQILTEEIAKNTVLQDKVQLIYIDGSKIIDRDNPAVEIYDQMLDYHCSERTNGEPENMPSLKFYWHSLQRNSNKLVVMVFYDSTALEPEWAGFSQSLLDALKTFKGAICIVTEQPVGNLKQFSSREPHLVENIVEWITSHHLD